MEDITFGFHKIGEEELKIISGGGELNEKFSRTVREFTLNFDQEDPEYITLREAFMQRFKEHGFVVNTVEEYNEHSRALDEVLQKLTDLQKRNTTLLRKYNGDTKFARVHKRIREQNNERRTLNQKPIISFYDDNILTALSGIKNIIDQKVYDRNDILKKDAYFEQTVMTEITAGMDTMGIDSIRDDRLFIQSRITKQYLEQYNQTYAM